MAIRIAETVPDTTIDTITLSSQQLALAEERIAAAGLSHRIRVHLMDYRDMPSEWEHAFDRVVSIEMLGESSSPSSFVKRPSLPATCISGAITDLPSRERRSRVYVDVLRQAGLGLEAQGRLRRDPVHHDPRSA